ncbi:SirB2 family protein [Cytophaga aurantiaca]|uniref:SirB2 family protein n=1 Tax=Cytophaga aurantiaca TaxID=29530 RepID=UPI0003684391|nr:SirB2 family protein [Cytophaga aurantiaca]
MEKGFLHLHVTIVSIFILLYVAKVYLLLANKSEALEKLRSKTKIADMILGSLIIITGVFLTVKMPSIETFLIVKIILVLASIPIGIIAMKKANKPMAITALLIYVYVFALAKTDSLRLKKEAYITPVAIVDSSSAQGPTAVDEGEIIYTAKCALCHGADGKLMLNGAKDLSVSKLTKSEAIEMIKSGKGIMPPFKDEFNEKQLNALADYAEGLRK